MYSLVIIHTAGVKYIISLVAFVIFLPQVVSAHTRWFAEREIAPYVPSEPLLLYLSIWIGVCLLIVLIGIVFENERWFQFSFLNSTKPHVFERASSTFIMVTGTFFMIAGTHEYLFSPNLTVASGIPMGLVVIQIIVGLAFLLGIASRVAGIVLGILWLSTFFFTESILVFENIWVLSIAIFATLMGNNYFSILSFSFLRKLVAPYKHYALSFLRLGTGITLMVLGLSEKILAPELGINFLTLHHWNFMHLLGFTYSDYLFTISAGAVEFLFGLVFVLGVVTRLNALVVAIVFSIPLFILGPIELAGHLPHFAAIVLLLMFGSGGHFTFFNNKNWHQHTS